MSQWRELTDPVALVGAMWLHSPQMRSELAAQKKSWPELSGQDLADLQVYLRHSAPGGQSEAGAFQISAPAGGEQLFAAKGCAKCHGEQGRKISRSTLTGTAAAMWNHARILRYQAPQVNPQEMRGLVSYTWARPYFEPTGSVQRGRQVFTAKKCSTCHEGGGGPDLHARAGDFNGISMISSLWRHGPSMLGRMTEQKMPWPIFRPGEMSDLLAFLNTPSRTAGGAR